MKKNKQQYVIGVDGGGTKTFTALADLNANIIRMVKTGPASPRNVGIEKTAENVASGINRVLRDNVGSVFIGLPAVQEEYGNKIKEIEKEILKRVPRKLKIKISSDQAVAFRSGTDETTGIILIAGTGCVAHGWRGGREEKSSGWGWLADEGSAIWVGRQIFPAILKDIDGRGPKTSLTKKILEKLKVETPEKLVQKIYQENFLEIISSFSILCDQAAKEGDKLSREILRQAGNEAALVVATVAKKLGLSKVKFPLVFVGSMFKAQSFKGAAEFFIRQSVLKAQFIYPANPPVFGAVKLAIEQIKH